MPNGHDNDLSAILARMDERLGRLQQDVGHVSERMVTRDEFEPIRRVVYGLVGLALVTVAGAVLRMVIAGGGG